jgi:DNA-binding NtrC family response regulator
MATILCVDDEPTILNTIKLMLERAGHQSIAVHNGAAALNVLERRTVDLVMTDYQMPEMNGLELVSKIRRDGLDVPIIVLTGYGSIERAVAAIKAGATDYLAKPVRPAQLQVAVDQALELSRLQRENRSLKEEVTQLRGERTLIGDSDALARVIERVRTVAPTRTTVLVQGESGTGKELVARSIHHWSDRADGPFIAVNCAALPAALIESSLLGHEKGAFTGATRMVKGAFERADRGTLLLDEVTEMHADLQAKLLRVIQEQEFERVGGTSTVRVDVRIVATTNRDLKQAVRDGGFREDLYYRLAVVPVIVPPLRQRKEDIPALAHRFAVLAAQEVGRSIDGIAPETMAALQAYHWPGNVRELAHAVQRAVILSQGSVLGPDSLELGDVHPGERPGSDGQGLPDTLNLKEIEALLIDRALEQAGQNRTRAADLLGINVRTLRNKLNG